MRNYRAGLAKWQSADPMGYPDGWNQFAYGVNSPAEGVDLLGARWKYVPFWYSTEYPFQVIMPGGLPLDPSPSPGFWATLISWLAGEGASTVTNYAIDIMLPLWTRYKAYADEHGLGLFHDPTKEEAEAEMKKRGYADWEYVSVDYLTAKADMYVAGEALVVERITVCWQVKMSKWVDE